MDFSDKGCAIKGLVICWMLLNLISTSSCIPLQVDDHLKSKENPAPNSYRVAALMIYIPWFIKFMKPDNNKEKHNTSSHTNHRYGEGENYTQC